MAPALARRARSESDDEFYKPATKVDRGHIVRRDDNCWGRTALETEFANSDTFHWTNCTPQHEAFNQSRRFGLWGELEDVVKEQAQGGPERLSIFAGPVLAEEDPEAYGIQYPVKFWKVVAAIVDGGLQAYAFVLDQTPVIKKLGLEERLDFGKFNVKQLALADIQQMTGVRFPQALLDADTMEGAQPIDIDAIEKVKVARVLRATAPGVKVTRANPTKLVRPAAAKGKTPRSEA